MNICGVSCSRTENRRKGTFFISETAKFFTFFVKFKNAHRAECSNLPVVKVGCSGLM